MRQPRAEIPARPGHGVAVNGERRVAAGGTRRGLATS